jgi:hypothetical protein
MSWEGWGLVCAGLAVVGLVGGMVALWLAYRRLLAALYVAGLSLRW